MSAAPITATAAPTSIPVAAEVVEVAEVIGAKKRKPSVAAERRRAAEEAARMQALYRYWAFLVYIPSMYIYADETLRNQRRLQEVFAPFVGIAADLSKSKEWAARADTAQRVIDEIRRDQDGVHHNFEATKAFCLARGMPECRTGLEVMMNFSGSYFNALEVTQTSSQRQMHEVPDEFFGDGDERACRFNESEHYVDARRFQELPEALSATGLKAFNAPSIILDEMRKTLCGRNHHRLMMTTTQNILGFDVCTGASLKPL